METTYHAYCFDVSTPEGKAGWEDLKTRLAGYPHTMHALGDYYHPDRDGTVITLETGHLFDNQWNTAPVPAWGGDKGFRVFDWAQEATEHNRDFTRRLRRGHYLDQTAEMREIRRNTMKCGYCGKQEPAAKGYVFCPHCIDSEYLTEKDLPLTRMIPVDKSGPGHKVKELTEAERAHLLPLYREAQLHGVTERGKARIAAKRRKVMQDYETAIHNATTERDGFVWLMDHGINTDNVIFYKHTGRFGFGWRQPMGGEVLAAFLEVAAEFGWPYDIKTEDGRTLSGN